MTDRISLTAAELAFLLSVTDGAAASPAPALLGFTEAESSDAVLAAGLGSLLLRHLAAPAAGQQVELAPIVTAVAEGMARPQVLIQLGLAADGLADGALLFETGPVRFVLAPRAYRCFDVTGLDPAADRRDPLVTQARGFLERYRPGFSSFNVVGPDPRAWATVAVDEADEWTFVAGHDPTAVVVAASADDAMGRLRAELGILIPQFANL